MMKKKLIEVALPLEAINRESARERSIRSGHPSKLHLWWSRKPLATCRAVLFASLIDDPDQLGVPNELLAEIDRLPLPENRGSDWPNLSVGERRRQQLFAFIERLVKWENSHDEQTLATARQLINAATSGNPPSVYDPFAGGGSIPLEAQRLGLETHASDLNPVAVLINKALIEIPPKFANLPPVNPIDRNRIGAEWQGTAGLGADVRYYGQWMHDEAEKRIGHLYPKVKLPKAHGGGEATVTAWLWARTALCPNPACGAQMPLVHSFELSMKKGKETWAEPAIDHNTKTVRFQIQQNGGKPPDGTVSRRGVKCLICGAITSLEYVRTEGQAGRLGVQLMAIVTETKGERVYVAPGVEREEIVDSIQPAWRPTVEMARNPRHMTPPLYGMRTFDTLFTPRQLLALVHFSDLIRDVCYRIQQDAVEIVDRDISEYVRAVMTYLAFAVDKAANLWSSLTSWKSDGGTFRGTFARQALSMVWVFAEANPFSEQGENFNTFIESVSGVLDFMPGHANGVVDQQDAAFLNVETKHLFSTDPPYYDNVPYADLADFFYIWLRHSLEDHYSGLMSTLLVPKMPELIADPIRHGGRERARNYFEKGIRKVFTHFQNSQHSDYPLTIYYAYKQSENDSEKDSREKNHLASTVSTGWETMLDALIGSGFAITGTWPIRTERQGRLRETGSNALASSIVLVCRPRPADAKAATRREFLNALKDELPEALRKLQHGNIAPVDLAQAAIGPGMAVFSRYGKVVESDGQPMRVRTALQLINQELDVVLAEQEGEFDTDTRFAITWFDQHAFTEGAFGEADVLARAKNTSVQGLINAGIAVARGGKLHLLKRNELPENWNPTSDRRLTIWEIAQHLVHALDKRGEGGAAELLAKVGGEGEIARDLAYRLYTTCERKGWAQEALAYNSLVVAWPEITRQAAERRRSTSVQGRMDM